MSKKVTYTATTTDGRTFTRTTARTYTHAVVVTYPHGYDHVAFAGSEELARKSGESCFAVPNYLRGNPRAYAEEKARMEAWRAQCTVEVMEVTA